jgi:hypothetical protein
MDVLFSKLVQGELSIFLMRLSNLGLARSSGPVILKSVSDVRIEKAKMQGSSLDYALERPRLGKKDKWMGYVGVKK